MCMIENHFSENMSDIRIDSYINEKRLKHSDLLGYNIKIEGNLEFNNYITPWFGENKKTIQLQNFFILENSGSKFFPHLYVMHITYFK